MHDHRHVFVLRTLLGWYREEDDVEAQLPLLPTCLGLSARRRAIGDFEAAPQLLALAADQLRRTWEQRS